MVLRRSPPSYLPNSRAKVPLAARARSEVDEPFNSLQLPASPSAWPMETSPTAVFIYMWPRNPALQPPVSSPAAQTSRPFKPILRNPLVHSAAPGLLIHSAPNYQLRRRGLAVAAFAASLIEGMQLSGQMGYPAPSGSRRFSGAYPAPAVARPELIDGWSKNETGLWIKCQSASLPDPF
jgi:hypothetical protein